MAITKNVPSSGSVVSEQIESFLVSHGCVSTIPLSIGPLAKLNYLAVQDLVDTFTPKTKKRNFAKLNLFPLLLLKMKMKKILLTTPTGISLAWKSTLPGLMTRTFWNLLPLTNGSFSAIRKTIKSLNSRSIELKLITSSARTLLWKNPNLMDIPDLNCRLNSMLKRILSFLTSPSLLHPNHLSLSNSWFHPTTTSFFLSSTRKLQNVFR